MERKIFLDGNDWEADYFLPEDQYLAWKNRSRNLHNMLRNCAGSSGFIAGAPAPGAIRGTIPGSDRTFLLENGLCEDPFYARNLEHTSWSEKYAWTFRKRFIIPKEWKGERIRVEFKGLDYEARLFLNGIWLGSNCGMFMPAAYDITDFVKFGEENIIAAEFAPAPQGKPNHQDHAPADFAKYHRTQIGFGWDWSRGIVPVGIWDSVIISCYAKARLSDWHWCFDGKSAKVELLIDARNKCEVALDMALTPFNFSGEKSSCNQILALEAGANNLAIEIPLPENYQLWEPNGKGKQNLYTLDITLDGETESHRVGLRTVTMTRNPDSPEGAYDLTFTINGGTLFARGVNYVPADLLNSRATAEDYEHLVEMAKIAGINIFRIWGGGVIEKEAFFDACDRHGIMVWQEFMHACSNAPKDEEFIAFKERECKEILKKIRNHVSLTLLCGGNETQYYGEIPNSPIIKNYEAICSAMAPGIPFHVSSPDLSRPGERGHGPWNYREHEFYNTHFRLLASEIGCNGMPEFDSLRRFIPQSEIEHGSGPALEYHFYNRVNVYDLGAPLQVFEANDMKKFCDASMFAQADAARYFMEHYRRLFPKASGCIFWQYNEPWPTCTFSILDYYGVPKMALYSMKKANAPQLLSLEDDSWCCKNNFLKAKWYFTSDTPFSGTVAMRGVDSCGKELFSKEVTSSWEVGTTLLAEINETLPEGINTVFFSINGVPAGERIYGTPDYKQAFDLPKADVKAEIENNCVILTNNSQVPAFNIRLNFPALSPKAIRFSDNYIVLAPGKTRQIPFNGDCKASKLQISGWNV